MRRMTATNALTATTMLAGAAGAVGAFLGSSRTQGIALGVAVFLGAALLRSIARDTNQASLRQIRSLIAVDQRLDTVAQQLTRTKRKLDRRIEILDSRLVRETNKMTLRILGDINAARIEQVDAAQATTSHDG